MQNTKPIIVVKEIVPVPVETTYELHLTNLSKNDLLFLRALCGKIAGDNEKSGRRVTDKIWEITQDMGLRNTSNLVSTRVSIWAENYPENS